MPRIRSLSDSLPPKSRPRSVKCISTFLTTSPRYMPLIIFSYLKGAPAVTAELRADPTGGSAGRRLPLLPGVAGALVHEAVELRADVVQLAGVPERPPLHVDAHAPLVSVHQVHVLYLLHVAGVGPRA